MRNALSLENLTGIFRVSPKEPSRIINREGTTIEFKESYNHGNMAQYFKAMAAFANNQGGYILFGIGDKPRRLLGLKDKSLSQFEELKVEDFTKALLDYFSPEIKWEHCTFEFHDMSFGVIYVYPLMRKPCICKKHYDAQNAKYSLKEGDIYYRYGGRSERIRYAELASIIDEARRYEERQWLNFAKKAVRIGVSNAALLDLKSGNLSGTNGSVVIDSELLQKLAFIQEGKFVETGGTPTLRLIGDITEISTGKVIVTETARKVVRAIEPSDIVRVFLENKQVDEPIEYIKRICSYRQQWLTESIPETIEDVGYCIDALCCLSKEDFAKHDQYIRATMLRIYNDEYEKSSSLVASNIRKAICRIDEAIYLGS